uniref:Peptidase M48 domain-containing protein n=1 Tax=Fervidobacterium nodosum TaxID=2424 RepID=A0A7C5U653_9BACT
MNSKVNKKIINVLKSADREKINIVSMYVVLAIFLTFSVLFGVLLDSILRTRGLFTTLFVIFSTLQTLFGLSIVGRVIINLLEANPFSNFRSNNLKKDLKEVEDIFENVKVNSGFEGDIELYAIDSPSVNAISIGRLKHDHKICLTTGAIEKLDRKELEALFYHELFHIVNKDTDYLTTLSGTFGSPMLIFTISSRNLKRLLKNKSKLPNSDFYRDFILFSFMKVVSSIFLPISLLTNIFVSVKKEFDADLFAVQKTDFSSVISLFDKVKSSCRSFETNYYFMRHLFFSHPKCTDISKKPNRIIETYPSIDERVEFLKSVNSKKEVNS